MFPYVGRRKERSERYVEIMNSSTGVASKAGKEVEENEGRCSGFVMHTLISVKGEIVARKC